MNGTTTMTEDEEMKKKLRTAEYNKQYNLVHKEEKNEYDRKYRETHVEEKKLRDKKYYEEHKGCLCCEEKFYGCLDFHHTDGEEKENEVSVLVYHSAAIKKIQMEMDKCVLLCANCHKIEEDEKRRRSNE